MFLCLVWLNILKFDNARYNIAFEELMFSPDNVDALESMTPIPVTRGLTIKDAFNKSGDLEHGPQDQVHIFIVCSQYGMISPFAHL